MYLFYNLITSLNTYVDVIKQDGPYGNHLTLKHAYPFSKKYCARSKIVSTEFNGLNF